MRYRLTASMAVVFLALLNHARAVTVNTSGDTSQPFTTTVYPVTGGSPSTASATAVQDVALDAGSGPWHTNFANNINNPPTNGIPSGVNVAIHETLTNAGAITWGDWRQEVVTRTTLNALNDSPGFLFRQGSLVLQGDYGAGFVALVEGTDYTLLTAPESGPGGDTNWESVDILLDPSKYIQTGNRLKIDEQVFEVFGDSNIWNTGEQASIAQTAALPIPEPASIGATVICGIALLGRRAKRRGRRS